MILSALLATHFWQPALAHSATAFPEADEHGAWPASSSSHDPLPLQVFPPNSGEDPWKAKYGGTPDLAFSGLQTYAHLPTSKCLENDDTFDIAVLGIPFDTAVTYRPGARFGPNAIRSASRRQRTSRSFSIHHEMNPYSQVSCLPLPSVSYMCKRNLPRLAVLIPILSLRV